MTTKTIHRAKNIHALRAAIRANQSHPVEGRFQVLHTELDRLEQAEREEAQGVEDAPTELLDQSILV